MEIKSFRVWYISGLVLSWFVVSCSTSRAYKTPLRNSYGVIDNQTLDNGFANQRQAWVVFSDRVKNKTNPTAKDNFSLNHKEVDFLEPFVVLKKRKGMIKLGEYTPNILNDGRLNQRKRKIKVLGWVPQERLLLWDNSLKNPLNGFTIKATLTMNHPDVIIHSDKYIEQDSVILYKTPNLTQKSHKLSLGEMVYMYKESEDKQMILVGKRPTLVIDSIKNNFYGWVSKNMVSVWGDRTAIGVLPKQELTSEIWAKITPQPKVALSSSDIQKREFFENIYPTSLRSLESFPRRIKYFSNPFNYQANSIYNVLGNPIYYDTYKDILLNYNYLNIVFVVDMSQNNRAYIPIIKSLLQELRLKFTEQRLFSNVKIGAVVYKDNSCGISELTFPLTQKYGQVMEFFEQKIKELHCNDTQIGQPVDNALLKATDLLAEAKAQNQSNLIISIGTTANQNYQAGALIDAITKANARLIFFQTQAKTNDVYNNFVLLAEKTVVNSAKNIAEIKKERIVNQEDILSNTNYNLSNELGGVYHLDFPKQSMSQGFVIFPKKGEIMPTSILKSSIDSIVSQIYADNKHISSALTTYFRSEIGVDKTTLSEVYPHQESLTTKKIPFKIASAFFNKENIFLTDGYISATPKATTEMGVLLNEQEYEYLHYLYTKIYNKVSVAKNKRKAIGAYVKLLRKMSLSFKKVSQREIYTQPLSVVIGSNTGFYMEKNDLMSKTLRDWKRDKNITQEQVFDYFKQYKTISTKLIMDKNNSQTKIRYNGQNFYWLPTEQYVPKMK